MQESIGKHKVSTIERGRKNEERFFEAMNDPSADDMPHWYLGTLRPTYSQDRFEGIDAIVKTADVGKLFIQIKSSNAGKEKFLKGRHFRFNKSIIVIVIKEDDTPRSIRAKTRKLLSRLRWEYFEHKCNICNK